MFSGGQSLAPELLQELEQMAVTSSRRQLARHLCQIGYQAANWQAIGLDDGTGPAGPRASSPRFQEGDLGLSVAKEFSGRAGFGQKHQRYELPFEAKESVRWRRSLEAVAAAQARCPKTRWVGVGDREADIDELFVWAQEQPGRPALLVRAERDRLLSQEQGHLWEQVGAAPLAGTLEIKVPRRGAQPARPALLEVRFLAVEWKAPNARAAGGGLENIPLDQIGARNPRGALHGLY
jgi:hypothetical protein